MAELKKDWILNQEAFRQLLLWLDDGNESGGERYLEVRRRLTAYFDRKNCLSSDDLADETLNRIARKLQEKGAITEVSSLHYCYIVAKFVFLETARRAKPIKTGATEFISSDSANLSFAGSPGIDTDEAKEKKLDCLEKCLAKLPVGDRELILAYYQGEHGIKIARRSALATHLGITMNALSIRACRIRNRLEACVKACSEER